MSYKIFIDGKEGTTGLKIFERFEKRNDIEIISIDEDKRKDPAEKAKMINASDFTFLCLPDAAAIESAQLCTNPKTRIIDASTAHRVNPDWAYGFPELDKSFREKIAGSNRVNTLVWLLLRKLTRLSTAPFVESRYCANSGSSPRSPDRSLPIHSSPFLE